MTPRPPRPTRTDTLCPYTTPFRSRDAPAGNRGEPVGLVDLQAALLGALHDRGGEGMLGATFDRRDQREHLILAEAVHGEDVGELRLPLSEDRKSTRLNSSH